MARRIVVDLLGFTGARGGTETYAREICRRLPQHLPDATFAAVTGRRGAERVTRFFPGNVHVVPWVGGDRVTWAIGELVAANTVARRSGADLIWTPANFGPLRRGVPRVATIHDVTYHSGAGSPIARAVNATTAWLMDRTATTADAVISGSSAAADAVAHHMDVQRAEIHVIPHGTNDPLPVDEPWSVVKTLGLTPGRPIVLSTGNRLPHKNFEGLLAAVATIAPERRPLTVITGGGDGDPLPAEVVRLGLDNDVLLPGWVTAAQLEALSTVADVYACPSLAEGFGLPVIDAMRRGCIVIANDIPVLREVGGGVAHYADARDPELFGAAIEDAVAAAPDAPRHEAGLEWSRTFTWDRAAAATAAVFESVLTGRD